MFGFRKGRLSTNEMTYKCTPEILKALNIKIYLAEVFCNLSKVFDCVSHRILQHFPDMADGHQMVRIVSYKQGR
jgi:hypothetical protein